MFIEKAGFLQQVKGLSLGEKSLMVAVKNIARRLGDDISESKPILDSRLPDGSRVAAVIPPCSLTGVTLTIRKFNTRHFEMQDLINAGTLDARSQTVLRIMSSPARISSSAGEQRPARPRSRTFSGSSSLRMSGYF